jgi:two-component system NtrC family sensor kinase
LEQRLRQAEKLSGLGQMLSGVVHELNNPLASVCGLVEVSLEYPEVPERVRQHLGSALQEARRAARLLQNFLRLARAGGPEREVVDLNELLRGLIELRGSEFRKRQVELTQDLAPQLPAVVASLDQVQQIIIILLNNALQAMDTAPPPRKLRLASREQTNRLVFTVEDSGPGVPADLRARIFEPFFTTKPVGVGTGLGLSLAHSFAMEHHGRVWCDDSPLGGARFTVELPLPARTASEPAAVRERGPRCAVTVN